ncbi:MAG TPA: LysM peptidoglycan-binding domain-containing protein [Opitutaceae bacterium]|nr:LysM peptidoglycan-binding domain-containing protein [Opitutaceae bacterium]
MKILKFSGIVLGVHLLALIMIFANPGCSSSTKPPPPAADTVTSVEPAPTITVPGSSGSDTGSSSSSSSSSVPTIAFNSDTSAINAGVRYSPTRPNTPAATNLQAEPVSNVTPATTYVVVKNDSLWSVAHKNHLTTAELASANNLSDKAKLHLGQKLIIPAKGVPASATPVAGTTVATPGATPQAANVALKPSNAGLTHVVRPGETLSTIARRYGVKQGEIAVANSISDPQKIRAGMELIIPGGWESTGAKASKTDKAATAPTSSSSPAYVEPAQKMPPPAAEVPVIQVDDAPSAKTP